MRVAFSGSHRTGKTTLVEAIAARLPDHDVIDEPYRLLEDDGYEASDPPAIEDFERQLARSFTAIADAGDKALFDRCPLDVVAYLRALDPAYDLEPWLDGMREGLATLDLIVLVPIEEPDRIAVAASEDRRLRRRVDDAIRALVLDDPCFEAPALEVTGGVADRAAQVMRAMRR